MTLAQLTLQVKKESKSKKTHMDEKESLQGLEKIVKKDAQMSKKP